MKTELFSLSKIFTERLLRIPDYQRGYAWTEKQLKEFWGDIVQLAHSKNHYTGVLTLEEVPPEALVKWEDDHWIIESKSYSPFYIVDGQQRLTTSIILIQAIAEIIPEGEKLNYSTAEEIRKKFIYDSKDGGISRSYIFGYDKDNPSYECLKTQIFLENSDTASPVQETIYTHNLQFAKDFFKSRLQEMNFEQVQDLYRKLTQNFLFNIYSISNDIDVFVAFETMNNRGKPLSHLELLKNRLIYLSTKLDQDEHEKSKLRHCINETWKTVYHYLGKNKDNPLDDDLFLRHHFLHYFGHEPLRESRRLAETQPLSNRYIGQFDYKDYLLEIKFTAKSIAIDGTNKEERLSVRDVYDYANNLRDAIAIWYQIFTPLDSEFTKEEQFWLEKLNRLGISWVAPIVMAFYLKERSIERRMKLLKALERLAFITSLADTPRYLLTGNVSFLYLSHELSAGQISSEKAIKEIEQKTQDVIENRMPIIGAVARLRQEGFYGWAGIKYLLFEYELDLKEKSKSFRDKLQWEVLREDDRDFYTVEHIYPQRPRHNCWTSRFAAYTDKERGLLRHSLGNLLPLSKPKNSSFQNKCFEHKKGTSESQVGFCYGSYSEIEVANNSDWTAKEIALRGIKMLEFIERRWDVNLGSKREKLDILGLSFVANNENLRIK